MNNFNQIYDFLRDVLNISEETLDFAFSIYGNNEKTVCNLVYHFSGYNDLEQFIKEEL